MRTQPLPLLVLTGFLGSGKTSTLQHWLAHTQVPLRKVAVIINDFGEVNVDAALLNRRQLELRSITGGCVCCQSFDDLAEQILVLAQNPDLDLVWIETSGLADPEEVLDHLGAPGLQEATVVRRMILVVDAGDFPCSWRGRAVQEEQIRYADLVLLNKTDRLDDAGRRQVENALKKINPAGEIVSTHHGIIEPERLSAEDARAAVPQDHDCDDPTHHHEHDHVHPHHDEKLPHAASTFFLPLDEPVNRMAFQQFLSRLPKSVFRAKGFVRLNDTPGQIHTFQQVRDQAELLLLPLEGMDDVATGLVFIGPHLEQDKIRDLAAHLVTRGVPTP